MAIAIIAGLGIDVKHPGYTNEFLIKIDDDLSILYSDSSILERMHISELFLTCNMANCNIFANLNENEYNSARRIIIEMILSTDLKEHYRYKINTL